MRIHKNTRARPLIFWVTIGLGALLVIFLSMIIWSVHRKAEYKETATKQVGALGQALAAKAQPFKALTEKPAAEKIRQQLAAVATAFQEDAANLPPLPEAFGVQLASEKEKAARTGLKLKIEAASRQAAANAALLDYELKIATILRGVKEKTGHTVEEQKNLAASWQALVDGLKAINPPALAKDNHKKMVEAAEGVRATIDALPDLTVKGDYAGFTAKQKELGIKLDALRAISTSFAELNQRQDKALSEDIKALQEKLK